MGNPQTLQIRREEDEPENPKGLPLKPKMADPK